ncbi:hypothetical protein [Massilia sp. YIM B04103]|uniref:hypothetical protein n=1 Tax=Massilia sp. YIM B04103 TaxID=2963106 RepID=UPI00210F1967|nr:hypothetical protein [Massilia sp. YIM B04103]
MLKKITFIFALGLSMAYGTASAEEDCSLCLSEYHGCLERGVRASLCERIYEECWRRCEY